MPSRLLKTLAVAAVILAAGLEISLRLTGFEGVALYETWPDGFYRMRPGSNFLDGGRTNRLGLRGELPEHIDIVMLGDSVVFGTGLRTEAAIPARLEQISGLRVLNAGVPGYGAREPALLVQRVIGELRAPHYIELLTVNDVTETSAEPLPLPFWVDTRTRHSPVRLYEFGVLLAHYWRLFLIRGGFDKEPGRWTQRIAEPEKALAWVTDRMKELEIVVRAQGGDLTVILSPWRSDRRDPWTAAYAAAGGHDALLRSLTAAGIVAAAVSGPPDGLFADDIHFTPEGARWMAGEIRQILLPDRTTP